MIVEELPAKADVVVVGAGIAGVSTAYFLARNNVDVLLIDRVGPAAEASSGNAGMIGESGGDPRNIMHLQRGTVAVYREVSEIFPDDFELVIKGRMRIALNEEEVKYFEQLVKRQNEAGVPGEMVYGDDIQRLEPQLSKKALAVGWFPGDGKINPTKATKAFFNAAVAAGATALNGVTVTGIETSGGKVTGVATDKGVVQTGQVVLAAGAWSPWIAASLGLVLPIFPGKGNMLKTEPLPPISDKVYRAERIGARQLADGAMLIGSEIEFAGFDKSPNPATIASYLAFMQELIPGLANAKVAESWGCLRPMSIDLLPILGPVSSVGGLYLNTGHGRSGMTLGPASSKALVELMVTGKATFVDLAPYSYDRFAQI